MLDGVCNDLGTKVIYYAHASAGCLHVKPLINTKVATDIDKLPNLAKDAKASSPDGLTMDGPHSDTDAIDGNVTTYWDKTDNHPLYRFRVDLAEKTDISAISIVGFAQHSFSPKDFEILCDGKVVKKITGARYKSNLLAVEFPATQCKTLELKITGYYGKSPGIRELEIFQPRK